jgi:hypothetical protein
MTAYGRFRKAQRIATPTDDGAGRKQARTRGLAALERATGECGTEAEGQIWSLRDMCQTKRGYPGPGQHRAASPLRGERF